MRLNFYRIKIDSKYIYRFLNCCNEIEVRNIVLDGEYAYFSVDSKYIDKIRVILEQNNIAIIEEIEQGIIPKFINFNYIKNIVYILCILMILLVINSFFIWKITVKGNYSYTYNQLKAYICNKNIKEGILKNKIDTDKLEKNIRKDFSDISWVCVEIKGTNLVVHIKENYITEISDKEDKPYDLVAECDAKIVSSLVRTGKIKVKTGDDIKKGDVLISGAVDVTDESGQVLFNEYCNADGEIVGEVREYYKDSLNVYYLKKNINKEKKIILPAISGYRWIKNKDKNTDVTLEENKLKFYGEFYLPIAIQKYTVKKYTTEKIKYTRKQAEKILQEKFEKKMSVKEQKGYKIVRKNVRINKNDDTYILEGEIIVHKPLGKVSYIDIEKIEEGTTTLDERD